MEKKKNTSEKNDVLGEQETENILNEENVENANENSSETSLNEEMEILKAQLSEKNKQCEEYLVTLQRTAAEFDNFKKRTAREKEALYVESTSDTVTAFLPVLDNMERALKVIEKEENQSLREGVDMVFRQLKDVMKSLGVEEIKAVGETFDPQLHNAVMHVEGESYGENTVIEEFQKGYILKGKVIRYSMVKVAN